MLKTDTTLKFLKAFAFENCLIILAQLPEGAEAVLLEGWLDKRGRLNTAWRRRHFVLRADGFLNYYATKNEASGGDEEVQLRVLFC